MWLDGVPHLYAIKHGLKFEDAKKFVTHKYGKVGRERLEWYDLGYWVRKLGLDVSPEEILGSFQNRIETFSEVTQVLEELRHVGLRLIVLTNARREFADLEIENTKIGRFFERIFSATSDFRLIKKTPSIYKKVCKICGITPSEMTHVGDDECFDVEVPREIGIEAFYLDRTGNHSGRFVIHTLNELGQKLVNRT